MLCMVGWLGRRVRRLVLVSAGLLLALIGTHAGKASYFTKAHLRTALLSSLV